MKKLDTLFAVNTDPNISAHIFISYYSSSQPFSLTRQGKPLRKTFRNGLGRRLKRSDQMRLSPSLNALYVKVGDSVVLMRNLPKETVLVTLRRMLTVLAIFPKFFVSAKPNRSRLIQDFLVSNFVKKNVKKYSRLPLNRLYIEAFNSVLFIRSMCVPYRIRMSSFPDVKVMLLRLTESVCSLIDYTLSLEKNTPNSR